LQYDQWHAGTSLGHVPGGLTTGTYMPGHANQAREV
jgi:hypothetical protein